MVIFSEMTDGVKKEEKFVVDIEIAALETRNKDPCFPDLMKEKEIQRNEVTEISHEMETVKKVRDSNHLSVDEDPLIKKRRLQCFLPSLNWIRNLAKDPLDPNTALLPETSKWKFYDSDLPWKQILSIRNVLKKKVEAPQPSVSQKKQKMHPGMYGHYQCGNERVRCSRRILAAKDYSHKEQDHSPNSSSTGGQDDESCDEKQSDDPDFWFASHRRKRTRVGPHFQADLPESFGGERCVGDPKWLGTMVWPLDKSESSRFVIERDPIGIGRPESCGCQFPGQPECVRFHIRERRIRKMLELRSAFYTWKLDYMGENVALSWTKEDQKNFQDTVETNRLSSDKYFWDELFKCFPRKGREALVSYYFNVFVLRRRSEQNRSGTCDIYSDDEESEFGPIGNRFGQSTANSEDSIFCSPKKTRHPSSR